MTVKKIPNPQGKSKEYEVGYKKPPVKSRWKKGQSGNPKGYKPPQNVIELNALIDEVFAEEVEDVKGAKMQKIKVALNKLVLSKSPAGQIYIFDRRYGKVPQAIEGELKGEIVLRVVRESTKKE